jgi:hypothetical protein
LIVNQKIAGSNPAGSAVVFENDADTEEIEEEGEGILSEL